MDIFEQFPATVDNPTGFSREKLEGVEYSSYSRLAKLWVSPAAYKKKYIDKEEEEVSEAREFGKLVHMAVLETEEFRRRYIVAPIKEDYPGLIETVPEIKTLFKELAIKVDSKWKKPELIERLTKVNPDVRKKIWACIEEDFRREVTDDHIVVTATQSEHLVGMIGSIQEHLNAGKLLTGGDSEIHTYFYDKEFEVVWYGVLDYMKTKKSDQSLWITELKTTRNASDKGFSDEIWKWGYFMQSWLYPRMVRGITDGDIKFCQLAIENKGFYGIGLFEPDDESDGTAAWLIPRLLQRKKDCEASGRWPVYKETIRKLGIPNYARWQLDEMADRGLI